MFASLDSIDIVTQRTDGRREYWQTDHRTAQEIEQQPALSVLFALTRILNPLRGGEAGEARPVIIYSASHPPPEFLRRALGAAGALLTIGDDIEPKEPVPAAVPAGGTFVGRILGGLFGAGAAKRNDSAAGALDAMLQRAFAEPAASVAAEHGVPLTIEGLRTVEDAIAASQPDPEVDEAAYWTAVFELGSFGGEVLRAACGGRWVMAEMGTLPFALSTTYRGGPSTVNPLGKAIKRFAEGEEDSLVALVNVIRANP